MSVLKNRSVLAIVGRLFDQLLLATVVAQQSNTVRLVIVITLLKLLLVALVFPDDLELLLLAVSKLIIKLISVFIQELCLIVVDVVEYWILNAAKVESAIKNCSTIVFISLSETRILMELSQDFVKSWNWSVLLWEFQLTHILLSLVLLST